MLKHIFKLIWNQRRANGWIFAELLIVIGVLWMIMDVLLVDVHTYNLPLGYDIENTFRLKLGELNNQAPGYVPAEAKASTDADDLLRLMDQIRLSEEVEEVCVTFYSCPYSGGSSFTSMEPVDGDTIGLSSKSFQVRRVSPEYFTVFRVKDKDGQSIIPQLNKEKPSIVISADMEEQFFGKQGGQRRKVKPSGGNEEVEVSAVCQAVRASDYEKNEPCFYTIIEGNTLDAFVGYFGASGSELCVRMKKDYTPDEMNMFLESMGDRLTVNNLYVYGARKFTDQRESTIRDYESKTKIKISLMAFMLINVFFGIIGTFWLRTQYRKGEMGLRVALGSSKSGLYRFMNAEGVCILLLTLPVILLLLANLAFVDLMEVSRLPLSLWRFVTVTCCAYLLMGGMICLGIWFPARKAANLPPAEALHYE